MEKSTFTKLFTIKEALSLMGIGRTSLYQEIKFGRLKYKKFGSKTLILASSVEEWISNLPESKINGGM